MYFFFLLMGIILGQCISDNHMEKPHTKKKRMLSGKKRRK